MPTPATRTVTPWPRTIVAGLVGVVAVTLLMLAFLWPGVTASVQNVPVAVVGESAAVDAVTAQINESADNAFTFTTVDDADAAADLIREREAYGAIVLGAEPEVMIASGAGTAISQMLTGVATAMQAQATQAAAQAAIATGKPAAAPPTVTVTDLVPLAEGDPRGTGLASASFPLVLGGMIGGIVISTLVVGTRRRLTALAIYTVVASIAIVAVMQGWFGIIQGSVGLNLAAVALSLVGTASFIVGLNSVIGAAGIGVGAAITMFVANPISAAAVPREFLVGPWGAIGQFFVPGASATLMRDVSYFPDADSSAAWLVLGAWAVVGLLFTWLGHRRTNAAAPVIAEPVAAEPVAA